MRASRLGQGIRSLSELLILIAGSAAALTMPLRSASAEDVQARLAEWDQALGERFVFSLSRHWGTKLELIRVRPGQPTP